MQGNKFDIWNEEIHTLLNQCAALAVGDDKRTHIHEQLDAVLDMMSEYDNRHLLTHSPDYHPEVDWKHYFTVEEEGRADYDHTLDAHLHRMLDVYINEEYARTGEWGLNLLYAIIFHDIGKKATAEYNEEKGWHTYIGHDKIGVDVLHKGYMDLPHDIFNAMVAVCDHHMNFWTVSKLNKMRAIGHDEHFTLIAHLCRIDKMMDGSQDRKQHGLWMKRCGEFKNAMQPTGEEQTAFIQSCFALMDMNANYMGWEMTKDGPTHTGADAETLDQLLYRIKSMYLDLESMDVNA
tara:strand:+ start:760 stop:1632 length:873 start_codon:yes stop_codon:yes gene_type:complete